MRWSPSKIDQTATQADQTARKPLETAAIRLQTAFKPKPRRSRRR